MSIVRLNSHDNVRARNMKVNLCIPDEQMRHACRTRRKSGRSLAADVLRFAGRVECDTTISREGDLNSHGVGLCVGQLIAHWDRRAVYADRRGRDVNGRWAIVCCSPTENQLQEAAD